MRAGLHAIQSSAPTSTRLGRGRRARPRAVDALAPRGARAVRRARAAIPGAVRDGRRGAQPARPRPLGRGAGARRRAGGAAGTAVSRSPHDGRGARARCVAARRAATRCWRGAGGGSTACPKAGGTGSSMPRSRRPRGSRRPRAALREPASGLAAPFADAARAPGRGARAVGGALRRADSVRTLPPPRPSRSLLRARPGDWRGAVARVARARCPVRGRARGAARRRPRGARSDGGAAPARSAAAAARAFARDRGCTRRRALRGPRRSTLANAAGLTRREQEVLRTSRAGATNAQIAARAAPLRADGRAPRLGDPRQARRADRTAAVDAARSAGLLAGKMGRPRRQHRQIVPMPGRARCYRSVAVIQPPDRRHRMSSNTQTGTAQVAGRLWSARADDWAEVQERFMAPAYEAALDALARRVRARDCSTSAAAPGLACGSPPIAAPTCTALDAAPACVAHARRRVPGRAIVQRRPRSCCPSTTTRSTSSPASTRSSTRPARPRRSREAARVPARRAGASLAHGLGPARSCASWPPHLAARSARSCRRPRPARPVRSRSRQPSALSGCSPRRGFEVADRRGRRRAPSPIPTSATACAGC